MAAEKKPSSAATSAAANAKSKKRKYLPHGRPVKKGPHPLRPGVEGFFITCDGGREHQAAREALNLLDSFYEEMVHGKDSGEHRAVPSKPLNKKIKFKDSDDSSGDEDEAPPQEGGLDSEKHAEDSENSEAKKQRVETDSCSHGNTDSDKGKDKSIDELIEDELKELGDRNKRHFVSLDSGCNGVIFIQMHKRTGDPSPASIVQRMMSSAASTRKHMSRFILRILPAELTCYASEEEILKAIKPLIAQYFPTESSNPHKFAVLYEARSNTGIERMAIINAVAKSVPQPHKVDLNNPDKTIIVQIVKTICLVGVVERYKELSKYNLRQLTSVQT